MCDCTTKCLTMTAEAMNAAQWETYPQWDWQILVYLWIVVMNLWKKISKATFPTKIIMKTIKTGCQNNTFYPSVKTACEHELENDFPPQYMLFYYMLYSSKDFLVKRVFVVLQSITKGKGLHLVVHCIGQFQFLNSFSLFFLQNF